MMERLTYRDREGKAHLKNTTFYEMLDSLAHYEDLEEQGLLHKAEIKDGTPIWYIASLDDGKPFLMKSSYIYNVTEYEIGSLEKDFWLSEEEAEAKLKELENV